MLKSINEINQSIEVILPKKFVELPPPLHFVENFSSKIKIIGGEEKICI